MRGLPMVAVAIALATTTAAANGRNPHTTGIYWKPGDARSMYVATTFGLLASKDGGCTLDWMCEQSIGYDGTWDPHYAIAADGTIYATTFEGLRISRDGGCSFTTASATKNLWIDALTIGPTGEIWVGIAETAGVNDVLSSRDNGATFTPRGMASAAVWWKSVLVAPSNPQRVYITGYQVAETPTGYFYRSDTGGAPWTPSPLANVTFGGTPVLRVQAVDPANPDIVFMSSEAASTPGDRLYRSTDGGMTWTETLATSATIHDVLIRDATRVFVATQLRTASSLVGGPTYVSTDGGVTFAPLSGAPELACIAQGPDGALYGCGANWEPDFKAVARSVDHGATWDKVWRFVELNDAVQCAEGTVQHDTCDVSRWDCPSCGTDLKRKFSATGPTCAGAIGAATPKKSSPGCCGAGDPVGALWSVVIAGAVAIPRRRRRARRAASAS